MLLRHILGQPRLDPQNKETGKYNSSTGEKKMYATETTCESNQMLDLTKTLK